MYEKEEKKKGESHVSWWKVFLVLAICLFGILLPISGIAANTGVQTINRDLTVLRPETGKWSKSAGRILYFGSSSASGGLGFRVLAPPSSAAQVLAAENLFLESAGGGWNQAFGSWKEWSNSNPRSYFNGSSYYNSSNIFSALEKKLIAETTLKSDTYRGYSTGTQTVDHVFVLSVREKDEAYATNADRHNNRAWQLTRSTVNGNVAGYNNGGSLQQVAGNNGLAYAVAFNLNTADPSILFASENDNNKTSALSAPASSSKQAWKLTLLDSSKSVELRDGLTLAKDGNTIIVPYSHSGSGVNRVTVMITDKEVSDNTFEILYYGALQDVRNTDGNAVTGAAPQKGSGTFEFPSTLNIDEWGTTYHVYLMAEQVNNPNYTDYASTPVAINLPAVTRQKINQVSISFTEPQPTDSFPEKSGFTIVDGLNNDISTWGDYTVTWKKKVDDTTLTTSDRADYATDYVVSVELTPNDSHFLAKDTQITINGNNLSSSAALVPGAVGDYYGITAAYEMRTRNPRITSIVTPNEIPLANGVAEAGILPSLPTQVKINVEDGTQPDVDVTWGSIPYDRNRRDAHDIVITGTIGNLPAGVDQADPTPITATTVTVKIQAAQEINTVAVAIDDPDPLQNFDSEGTVNTANVKTPVSLTWKNGAATANNPVGFDTTYTAEFSLEADYGYIFADSLQVTVNGNQSGTVNVDSSNSKITAAVGHTFAKTRKATLTSIATPTYSGDIPNRTGKAEIAALLNGALQQVEIIYEGDKKTTAPVTWSEPGTVYNPDILAEQTFAVEGTVILPTWIDAGSIPATASVMVTVKQADPAKAPTASLDTTQVYTTNQFATLSSTTPDAEIYYTLDGTDPDKSSPNSKKYTTGDRISIQGVEGRQEIVTLKAIAYKEHMYPSTIAEFRYTMELAKTIPSVALTDIAAPTVNQPFDTVASTASAGVSAASLGVRWSEKSGASASGTVKYHTVYVASLDLAPAQY
ncbi:MAG: chitobiase/beta-hexosaminidase C-terminal domain-containing protein, partial [Roseburia sp.]